MRALAALFTALVLRHAILHKGRTFLTLASVAIGVAVTVAVRLANASAVASFTGTANTVAGGTAVQIVAKGNGLPDGIVLAVRHVQGVASVSPVVSGSLTDGRSQAAYDLVGVDLLAALGMASDQSAPSIGAPGGRFSPTILWRGRIVLSESLARAFHTGLGSGITMLAGSHRVALVVGGIVPDAALPIAARNTIFCDVSTAQEALGRDGLLDRIDLVPLPGVSAKILQARLRAVLPRAAGLTTPGERADQLTKMVSAFQFNLAALAAIALLVGAYLVFNAVSMSVVQRRAEIGTARAVGTTRPTIFAIFLAEGAAVGIVGSALGLLLGRLLANGALRAVAGTFDALY
ncbi:MAG: ABC transporter permease, partial [Candidatus Eremiobacteraeota bacterium]|nr:ABC transporter permease [Candidatus Eremiobacteraeota bacterium]